MLEAVFTRSAKGSIQYAMRKEVYCFPDDLSTGDISEDSFLEKRMDSMKKLYSFLGRSCAYYADEVKESEENLKSLILRMEEGEPLRIWFSDQPMEYCGMCWLVSELKKRLKELPQIIFLKLPETMDNGSTLQMFSGWGEIGPEEIYKFLTFEKEASSVMISTICMTWTQMKEKNTALRAIVNGSLQSVPESFYDSFIEQELEECEEEFHEAHLIGDIMGKYRLKISDVYLAYRIESMIENGKLEPVTESGKESPVYRRMLKKL